MCLPALIALETSNTVHKQGNIFMLIDVNIVVMIQQLFLASSRVYLKCLRTEKQLFTSMSPQLYRFLATVWL